MPSIQARLYPDLPCFGCGPGNAKGLQLKSYPLGDGAGSGDGSPEGVVAAFTPWPEHDNGLGYLNGGIIATVLDCHSAAAVTHEAFRRGWRPLAGAALPYVTAGLDVHFLRPSPLTEEVLLRAHVVEASEAEITADVTLHWGDKVRAGATARWRRWRPR